MKNKKQKAVNNRSGGVITALRRPRALLILLAAGICLLAVIMYGVFATPVKAALSIPADYGTGYGVENLTSLENEAVFEGIICKDKVNKSFLLSFDEGANGLVTLARISQNSSLEGYTFEISLGSLVELNVKYDENHSPISGGSFFGIGNDTYPFKGNI
ncbi:MAG: hypothetical protein ACI4QR_04725, partial [Eubacteriales bacterium]